MLWKIETNSFSLSLCYMWYHFHASVLFTGWVIFFKTFILKEHYKMIILLFYSDKKRSVDSLSLILGQYFTIPPSKQHDAIKKTTKLWTAIQRVFPPPPPCLTWCLSLSGTFPVLLLACHAGPGLFLYLVLLLCFSQTGGGSSFQHSLCPLPVALCR